MNNPQLPVTAWPEDLAWIVKSLLREHHQEFIETQMDSGPPKRRVKSSPVDVFTGAVEMDDPTWRKLDRLFSESTNNLFQLNAPDTGEAVIAAFLIPPRDERTAITKDATMHLTRIVLRPLRKADT